MSDFDFDFSGTKWVLLKQLEKEPLSPKELASLTSTSVANASQQLKLLEAQGYLKKIKIKGDYTRKDRDARILYSISKPMVWISKIGKDYVNRKEIKNPDNFLFNLLLCDLKDAMPVLKFFLNKEELFKRINCLFYLQTINNEIHFLIVTDDLDFFRKEHHSSEVLFDNKKHVVKFWSHSVDELKVGLERNEHYFVDLIKRAEIVLCDNEDVKVLFKEWRK
ncbi:ArsR family transcriptional regulator [Candidatus Woesearchaeota archaeon]|nr:ArsR family transcriptional regulator [Candidatus Woesearchaeota archaeon]